jgi:hypothetical protein
MTNTEPMNTEHEAFQRLLDSHGGDRARWPAAARLRFAQLLARDGVAQTMLAQAQALDNVLDRAPVVSADRQAALADRIMAAAAAQPPLKATTAPAVILPVAARRAPLRMAPAMALLAASLAVGIAIGLSGVAAPALNGVSDVIAVNGGANANDHDLELVLMGDTMALGEDTI